MDKKENKIDDDLYSRTIFTYGMDTMKKLSTMKVLIIGMRGLGIETAKNIILNGPAEVDIYDPTIVKINDLGSNFFLKEEDVGKKRRDEACLQKLSELNPYVGVSILKIEKKDNINEYIKHFCEKIEIYNVVVFTELHPMNFIDQINRMCRAKNIKFIYGICLGLVGYVFSDFGPKHIIFDETGKEIKTFLVKSITNEENGLVTIDDIQGTNNLNIGDGDFVKFKNVEGMTELNDENKDFQISMNSYNSFRIGDTSKYGQYSNGGIVYQSIKPKVKQYFPFCQRAFMICDKWHPLNEPDHTKEGRNELLYMALSGVHDFYLKNNCTLPEINNMEQAKIIVENVKKFYETAKDKKMVCYEKIQKFDEKIVLNVARWSSAHIQPICAFFGGILAQEIIKATGKYIPIDQWLIYDFFETVENLKDDIDRTLKNSRYDDQIAIFGNQIQEKIQKSNMFMVGAGATGCEFLKNFAMMGFCTDKTSKFVVTDDDNIEVSNLSRQFLFRKDNVGKSKSVIAVKCVQEMNPKFNAEGKQSKVCKETENIFDDDFWENQNFIIYAVDSVGARKYIDSKVILNQKIGADSGTYGTIAHSNIFIPHKTLTYQDIPQDENTRSLPVCTLRNFPSLIQHCIIWARDSFGGYFGKNIEDLKKFLDNYYKYKENNQKEGNSIFQLNMDKLKLLKNFIYMIINKDINKICEYAINTYTDNFDHTIQLLLKVYPPNYISRDGSKFWVGSKKLPHPIHFSTDIDLCLIYVTKFVFILSHALGIEFTKEELSNENIKKICSNIKIPEYSDKNMKIEVNEDNINSNSPQTNQNQNINNENTQQKIKQELDEIFKELDKIKKEQLNLDKIIPEDLEKDHDENGHIDFINACANLRARNYNIEECDRNKTKLIAGNITPTILTSTATIAAITSLQFYTVFQTNENKYFRNCYLNLNSNYFYLSIPEEPVKITDKVSNDFNGTFKAIPPEFNIWDIIEIKGPKTCGELSEYFSKKYEFNVDSIFIDELMIYECTFPPYKDNYTVKIEEAYEIISGTKISDKKKHFFITINGNIPETKIGEKLYKNVGVNLPKIKYIFK